MDFTPTSPSFNFHQHHEKPKFGKVLFPSSESRHTTYNMPSSGFRTSSWSDMNTTVSPRRRANGSSADKSCGSSVEPGIPLSKAELEARRDSIIDSRGLNDHSDTEPRTARDSFAELARKMRLDNPQLDIFTPEGNPYNSSNFLKGRRPGNLRALIISVILFLVFFGAIKMLVEYLLFGTRASASCTPSTVYIPVTRFASASEVAPSTSNSTTRLTVYSTATAVETMTFYVTMQPAVVATGLTSSGGPSYYFTVNSAGKTDWLNGISPPATASLTVITRSIYVTPVMPTVPIDSLSTTTATITSTATIQQTITVPAYTSAEYSYIEPDTTVTSTSTHYMTYTVSRVTSVGESTSPRASYSGLGTSGWNSSSPNAPGPTGIAAAAEAEPQLTTMTEIQYFGDDEKTTSTTTKFITTSVQVAYTTILSPAVPEPSDSPDMVTTVTALPVTITYSGEDGYSTSIAFNASTASSPTSSSRISSTSLYQTGASITSSLGSSGIFPVTAAPPSSSSGVFMNPTSAATVSAANYSPGVSPLSSLSSSAVATNRSTAGPGTGGTSVSGSTSSASITTAPGPISISISTSAIQTSSTSTVNGQSRSSSANTAPPLMSSASSSSGQPTLPSNINATVAGPSAVSVPSSAASSSPAPSSTPEALTAPLPAYGSYTPRDSASSSVSVEPASSSSTSSLSSPAAAPSTTSTSVWTLSSSTSSQTLSTSVRSSSSASSAKSSVPSVSPATASLNATLSGSLASTPQSSSTSSGGSSSELFYSQTFVPSTTSSVTGVPASAASSMPTTGCGEYGDFMLDFDNLPNFSPSDDNETDITQAPPIQSPYHHFTFSDGYVYAPDPRVPYEPISQPHLAVFLGNGTGMRASQAGNTIEDGEFADGPYEASSSFWFDVFSAWLGCDNEGPEVCTLVMSAYTYNAKENHEVLSFTQNATVEGCLGFTDCTLKKIEFPDTFKGLSGLQIQAFVGQEERMFFMDDIAMRWSDNSCASGLTRQRAR